MPTANALIIDDNPTNITVLQQLLQIEGVVTFTMSTTKNLGKQLDMISSIDIVFLDLEMPVLNGYQALEIIKSHPNFQSAKVVTYSVHVGELNNALQHGFDGFLGKPLSAESFPDQLSAIMRGETVTYTP